MTFRSRRLEALLGAQFDRLTYGHFEAIMGSPNTVESDDLDWKVKYHDDKKEASAELAKDVAAFANGSGGLLALGVAEDRPTSAASTIVDHPTTDRVVREFHQAIAAGVFPLPRFHIRPLTPPNGDGTTGLLLIGVPASPLAPHAVITAARPEYAYPRRLGNKIEWLREPEIATRYRRRFSEAASREERLDEIELDNLGIFQATGQREPIVTISLVPEIPGEMSINQESFRALQDDVLTSDHLGDLQRTLREVTVGSARLQATDARTDPRIHCDFHSDGSGVWGAVQRAYWIKGDDENGYVQTQSVVLNVLNALRMLSQHATHRAGATGTALVRVSLRSSVFDHPSFLAHRLSFGETPYDFESLHLGSFGPGGDMFEMESIRSVEAASGDTVCLLDSVAEEGLALTQTAAHAARGVVQAFGIVEIPQIRDDGAIRIHAWPEEATQWLTAWCDKHGVPVDRS